MVGIPATNRGGLGESSQPHRSPNGEDWRDGAAWRDAWADLNLFLGGPGDMFNFVDNFKYDISKMISI